jgi:DNA polymerase-3 subunit delta'
MTATAPGALLSTLRSRCRLLQLMPLDQAHMRAILSLTQPELSDEDLSRPIGLSGGSVGFAPKINRTEA